MRIFATVLIALAIGSPLSAQIVTVSGAEEDSTAIRLRALLDRGAYLLIDRDTTLSAASRIEGDLVVADARVNLEGTVTGSVAVLPGELFVRPGAMIMGDILEVGGNAYPSRQSEVGDLIALDTRVAVSMSRISNGYEILLIGPPTAGLLRLPSTLGVGVPRYDRVNGLTLAWGGEVGFGGDTAAVSLLGDVSYATARKRFGGGVEFRVRPTASTALSIRASRGARTQEGWIRDDLSNSASSLLIRSDVRNYHESDQVSVTISGSPPPPLIEGERFIAPYLGVRVSEDRSLIAASPWSLLRGDEDWRFNPAIDDGRLGSLFGGATAGWRGISASFAGEAAVEWSPGGVGDFQFAQVTASADWHMVALRQHQIEAGGYILLPVSGSAPRQRWSMIGGAGTLPTFTTAAMSGDHLLFIRSAYLADIQSLQIPGIGPPSLRIEYLAGTAWRSGDPMPFLEQNVGAGIQILFATAMIYLDPAEEPRRAVFSFGAHLPIGGSTGTF